MELQTFNNSQFGELRVAEIEGKVYYCGNDIANALGYKNPRKALIDHCKGVTKRDTLTNGGTQELSYIPEGDVYRLTARSKLPQAEKFESWVFDEVLPQIANTGIYAKPKSAMDLLELQYQALKEVDEKVIQVDERVTNIEENGRLDPGQYGHINHQISKRIAHLKDVHKWKFNSKQSGVLRHGFNKDILEITSVPTRSVLRQKDFDRVCEFISAWEPSSAIMQRIKDLANEG